MKLTDQSRQELFQKAKSINPLLGDLFQNPIDIQNKDLNVEIKSVVQVKIMLAEYLNALRELRRDI